MFGVRVRTNSSNYTKRPIKIQHSLSVYLQLAGTVVFYSAKYSLHYKDTAKAYSDRTLLLSSVFYY